MNDHLRALLGHQHDDLEQVGRAVRTDDEPPIWVCPEILDGDRVVDGMVHVLIGDAVTPGGGVDLHTGLLYYKNPYGRAHARGDFAKLGAKPVPRTTCSGSVPKVVDEFVEERETFVQDRFHGFEIDPKVLVREYVAKAGKALE